MFFKIKNYFMVVLGENDTNRINIMVKRMQEKGKCVQIMERTYILTIESDNIVMIPDVRQHLSGSEAWLLIVVRLDSDTNSAWCLKTDNSHYLSSVFKEIKD